MKRTLCYIFPLIACISLMALGCTSEEATREDVIGRYVANYDEDEVALDSLTITEDGTYTHQFKSARNEENNFTHTGTWGFENADENLLGKPRIYFDNYFIGYSPWAKESPESEENLRKTQGGRWSAEVEDGGERLLISLDDDLHYEKQE